MSSPYVGEIRLFAGNFAPQNWHLCDGSLLAISQFDVLFNLIGTTYGGDGQTTFALPDLRSRVPIHIGNNGTTNYSLGQNGGAETVIVTSGQLPSHTHTAQAAFNGSGTPSNSPANNVWSDWTGGQFSNAAPTVALNGAAISQVGGSQPHENMVPFLGLVFIISLFGIYPSQN